MPQEKYAVAFAREALSGLDGVIVKSASPESGEFVLIINGEERTVNIKI